MFRRSANGGDAQARLGATFWDRPLPAKIAGLAMLIGAAALLLGGAYREQSNMISTGLMFLFLGVVLVPDILRRSWVMRIAFCALAILGVFYALTT